MGAVVQGGLPHLSPLLLLAGTATPSRTNQIGNRNLHPGKHFFPMLIKVTGTIGRPVHKNRCIAVLSQGDWSNLKFGFLGMEIGNHYVIPEQRTNAAVPVKDPAAGML